MGTSDSSCKNCCFACLRKIEIRDESELSETYLQATKLLKGPSRIAQRIRTPTYYRLRLDLHFRHEKGRSSGPNRARNTYPFGHSPVDFPQLTKFQPPPMLGEILHLMSFSNIRLVYKKMTYAV